VVLLWLLGSGLHWGSLFSVDALWPGLASSGIVFVLFALLDRKRLCGAGGVRGSSEGDDALSAGALQRLWQTSLRADRGDRGRHRRGTY